MNFDYLIVSLIRSLQPCEIIEKTISYQQTYQFHVLAWPMTQARKVIVVNEHDSTIELVLFSMPRSGSECGMRRGLDGFNMRLKLKCRQNRLYDQPSFGWMKLSMSLNEIVFINFRRCVKVFWIWIEYPARRKISNLHFIGIVSPKFVMCN